MLLLIVGARDPARLLPLAGSIATAALVALGLALGSPHLHLALALHFFVAPALLAPRAARTLLPVQLVLLPASIFLTSVVAVALLPVLHSEAPAGIVAALYFAVEPGVVALWVGPSSRGIPA